MDGIDERVQRNDISMRRLRLVSDIMEDYQENIRSVLSLLESDLTRTDQSFHANRRMQAERRSPELDPFSAFRTHSSTFSRYFPNYARQSQQRSARGVDAPSRNASIRYSDMFFYGPDGNSLTQDRPPGFSSTEIEYATTELIFDSSLNSETQCPITLDYFQPRQEILRINGCGHVFSKPALVEWFSRHRECPVCRGSPIMRSRTDNSTPFRVSASVGLDASFNPIASIATENSDQLNAVNTILTNLTEGITDGRYEQELTVALQDLFSLTPFIRRATTNNSRSDSQT